MNARLVMSDGARAAMAVRAQRSREASDASAPPTPRECAASAAPVHVDDALAKRVAAAKHASHEAATLVKAVDRFDEAKVTLLHEVDQREVAVSVATRDTHRQAKV